jgi:hypothetical protein
MTEDAEDVLADGNETLFRQVHPNWLVDEEPSSQAFRPTPKDDGELSVSRGSKTTPQGAYEHHTVDLGLSSAGTWGVTVAEVEEAGLAAVDDPSEEDAAHAFIDFRGLRRGPTEARAKILRTRARDRGVLYRPTE